MKTMGVDLSAQPAGTACCLVTWGRGSARVEWVRTKQTDDDIIDAAEGVDAIAIDAPFGWPLKFVRAVSARMRGESWPGLSTPELRFRRTDLMVEAMTGKQPLSVSTDRLGIVAFRCARLLDRLGVIDRSGDGRVYEVYPGASLEAWGMRSDSYKRKKNVENLDRLCKDLLGRAPWLTGVPDVCGTSDDAFDSVICALTARAATLARTKGPDHEDAKPEGWIHVPECPLNELP